MKMVYALLSLCTASMKHIHSRDIMIILELQCDPFSGY